MQTLDRRETLLFCMPTLEVYIGKSILSPPQRPFLNNAANAPTDNNDTSSDLSHRRECLMFIGYNENKSDGASSRVPEFVPVLFGLNKPKSQRVF